jgi:hypothetical protein
VEAIPEQIPLAIIVILKKEILFVLRGKTRKN